MPNGARASPGALRAFGLGLGGMVLVVATVRLLRQAPTQARWLYVAAGVLLLVAVLLPGALRPLHTVSLLAGKGVGWLTTRLVLAGVYFLVLTPIGLALRLVGKDLLDQRIEQRRASYWRTPLQDPDDPHYWERQF